MTELDDRFFRHEGGRLVAMLSRRVGHQHLAAVEDAVQIALAVAVETWPRTGAPENPTAWLYRVAHRRLLNELRGTKRRAEILTTLASDDVAPPTEVFLEGDVRDDLLRMLFLCCDEALPTESQIALALRILCGFDVREISERLLTSEANVHKRLLRARQRLRAVDFAPGRAPTTSELAERRPAVQAILYLLFTEGYLSSHAEPAIRRDLCEEAIRLTTELATATPTATPETFALLALMLLHAARLPARQDGSGGLLLLEEQDRSLWDTSRIASGLAWLSRSAEGDAFSRYHAEAGIAAEHCLAPTFAETRWERVVACYELLERIVPSPLHSLNHAVAIAELRGPAAALDRLRGLAPPSWLEGSHLWSAVLADLHRRAGHGELAEAHRLAALAAAPSDTVRDALARRLR